ncbi:MAG: potassium channel family protein [Pseudomonadota bacterium]
MLERYPETTQLLVGANEKVQVMTRNHWRLWLDELRPFWLVVTFCVLLFGPATFYYLASGYSIANGLLSPEIINGQHPPVTFADAIYFSVVTQATLGYGDFRPLGWSRFVASLQVLFGLVFAGVVVGKITATSRTRFHRHARMACGHWTDIIIRENMKVMGLIQIYERDGTLEIDGWNYDKEARSRGTWHASLINDKWPVLVFEYSNQHGDMSEFTHGYSSISFYVDQKSQVSNSFQTKAVDAQRGAYDPFDGTRIKDPAVLRQLAEGGIERMNVIRQLLKERLLPYLEDNKMLMPNKANSAEVKNRAAD